MIYSSSSCAVCVCVCFRNESSETWQNVTGTSVIITVDSESHYNASVSSWTRLGDGGVVISISFTTLDAGNSVMYSVCDVEPPMEVLTSGRVPT